MPYTLDIDKSQPLAHTCLKISEKRVGEIFLHLMRLLESKDAENLGLIFHQIALSYPDDNEKFFAVYGYGNLIMQKQVKKQLGI